MTPASVAGFSKYVALIIVWSPDVILLSCVRPGQRGFPEAVANRKRPYKGRYIVSDLACMVATWYLGVEEVRGARL